MRIAIEKNAKILALFAIACTATVGFVNFLTKDRIIEQEQKQLLKTLNSIIAPEKYNNEMYKDCITIKDPNFSNGTEYTAYLAKYDDKPVAAALTATAPDGYNGNIQLLVAINIDGSISGVRVLSHKETPGLGDKIDRKKSDWVDNFSGKTIMSETDNRWAVAKDGGMFDQFTGATITPRAVVNSVKQTALYFMKNHAVLFAQENACRGNDEDE